jgi:hypothetical protein
MLQSQYIAPTQLAGVIVRVPNVRIPRVLTDFRPITLLSTDYKLFARIIAHRLSSCFQHVIHSSRHCGVQGRTIFDAISGLLDVVASSATTGKAVCLMSAFDISHDYLYYILRQYGLDDRAPPILDALYEHASSRRNINGYLWAAFPVCSSVRQCCPLSLLLFTGCGIRF